ncbi:MAG TPA: hypothetical protein VMA73_33110 [Streptosporangiaceae bacterium]|nr:hypothetical protein [Streptosporangiaceae bacterium]
MTAEQPANVAPVPRRHHNIAMALAARELWLRDESAHAGAGSIDCLSLVCSSP